MLKQVNILRFLNIFGLLLVLTLNYLANGLPLNGLTTGEVSALYPNYFVPAGYTFSIWGVIYLLLLIFLVYQARGWWVDNDDKPWITTIGHFFFLSCLFNATWIIAWHYLQPLLALGIMLLLLYTLIQIYIRLRGLPEPYSAPKLVRITFSIYLGWISVATIANTTAVLVHFDWIPPLLSQPQWAGLMMLVATALGIYFIWKQKDYFYPIVILWALAGIYSARVAAGEMTNGILIATGLGLAGITIAILVSVFKSEVSAQKKA